LTRGLEEAVEMYLIERYFLLNHEVLLRCCCHWWRAAEIKFIVVVIFKVAVYNLVNKAFLAAPATAFLICTGQTATQGKPVAETGGCFVYITFI